MAVHGDVDFDHFSPEFAADPAGAFRALREQCPVAHSSRHGGFWVVTGRSELSQVALDDATFSSARHPPDSGLSAIIIPQIPAPMLSNPIELDPPESRIYRKMLNPLLSPAVAEEHLRPILRDLTTYFVDRVIEAGHCDLILDIASPVPAMFTLLWLGMPTDEWGDFADLQHGIASNAPDSPEFAEAVSKYEWMIGLITGAIAQRRAEPADDVISYLTRQTVHGEPLSDDTILEMTGLLIAGGVDTTTSLTSQALRYLHDNPVEQAAMLGTPKQLQSATEEFLRVFCPVTGLARTVMQDTEVGGQQVHAGDRVMLAWFAANRDPDEFTDPDEIRLDRFPNRHTSFGLGAHRCVGSNLARVAFQEMVTQILRRMPDFEIDTARAKPYPAVGINSGWSALPTTFTPGHRQGPRTLPTPYFGLADAP